MYVAVKGGEKAIDAAHRLMAEERRGEPEIPELTVPQIMSQMSLAVDRVMSEGSLYDRELAAIAIKQSRGDLVEAVFLVRAYRTTLSRIGTTLPLDTQSMLIRRRISAVYKDLPGGQVLGPTFDYTHRLIDFSLAEAGATVPPGRSAEPNGTPAEPVAETVRVADLLSREDLIETESALESGTSGDLTREPLNIPAARDIRLQNLARADEGFLLAMAYSYQRGFGASQHPFVGEIRMGEVAVMFKPPELGFVLEIGSLTITECVMLNAFKGGGSIPPQYTKGYGLAFGFSERKAMSMSMVDRAMRHAEFGELPLFPVQDQEFMLYHSDNVEASGFVQHLKLPHYVDFQSDLTVLRRMKETSNHDNPHSSPAPEESGDS